MTMAARPYRGRFARATSLVGHAPEVCASPALQPKGCSGIRREVVVDEFTKGCAALCMPTDAQMTSQKVYNLGRFFFFGDFLTFVIIIHLYLIC